MINGIQDVYVNVENMERAVAFYCNLLGCEVTYSDQHWTSLDAYGLKIGLHWNGGVPLPPIPHDEHGSHVGATITFRSSDVAEDKSSLLENKVQIIGEINEAFGHLLIFKDSEGNLLKLMKQKYQD